MKPLCIITGGTSGMGFAIAKSLSNRYRLALIYKSNDTRAAESISILNGLPGVDAQDIREFKGNLSVASDAETLWKTIESWDSRAPELLVNCAGRSLISFFVSDPIEKFLDVFQNNLFSTVLISHHVVRKMYAARRGHIINFSSVASDGSSIAHLGYGMAKESVESFTVGLAREVGGRNVRVNCIRPGLVDTPLSQHAITADPMLKRIEMPMAEIVAGFEYLISDGAKSVSGTVLTIDSGIRGMKLK